MTKFVSGMLGGAWQWSILRRALLLVTPALDSLAVPNITESPLEFAKRLTQTCVQMPRSNAGMPKENLWTS